MLVYPTWWSGQPAMLKGWIDRVLGLRCRVDPAGWRHALRPRLRNVRRIVVVTTHGSSKLVNAIQGEGGKRTVTRALRLLCHRRCRTTWIALYGVDRVSARTPLVVPAPGRTTVRPRVTTGQRAVRDGDRDLAGDRCVVLGQGEVGRDAATFGRCRDPAEHVGGDEGARDSVGRARVERVVEHRRRAPTGSSSSAAGIGTATSIPEAPRVRFRRIAATSSAPSTRCGTGRPDDRV